MMNWIKDFFRDPRKRSAVIFFVLGAIAQRVIQDTFFWLFEQLFVEVSVSVERAFPVWIIGLSFLIIGLIVFALSLLIAHFWYRQQYTPPELVPGLPEIIEDKSQNHILQLNKYVVLTNRREVSPEDLACMVISFLNAQKITKEMATNAIKFTPFEIYEERNCYLFRFSRQ